MVMNKTTETNEPIFIVSKVYGPLTRSQAVAIFQAQAEAPRIVSFGKSPKSGWTDTDRIK